MRMLVIGATGGTGKAVLKQGTANGHRMVALARRPEVLDAIGPGIEVMRGDVRDRTSLRNAMSGCDVVISCLGVGGLFAARKAGTLLSEGMGNVVGEMVATGNNRLVAVSSVGVEDDGTEGFVYHRILKPLFLAPLYADMSVMERIIQSSELDWTILRPPRLTNAPMGSPVKTKVGGNVPMARVMGRAALAHFIVQVAEARSYLKTVLGVSE